MMATLFLLGDSTCAKKRLNVYPETGWGMCFSPFLAFGWNLDNRAVNGLSTKSALDEGIYDSMLGALKKGDWVIIQFGHNDSHDDEARHTDPWTTYQENLRKMVRGIQEKGGNALILSPIERRQFVDHQAVATHGDYPKAAQALAKELGLIFIDMSTSTLELYTTLGEETSRRLFNQISPGRWSNFPEGKEDNTHLSPYVAQSIAGMIATSLRGKVPFVR